MYVDKKIVVELDGYDYHHTKEQRNYDLYRQRELQLNGFHVIRFTGSEIFRNCEDCVEQVLKFIHMQRFVTENPPAPDLELLFCTRMQEVITHLLSKFGYSITGDGFITFTMDSYDVLSVERHGHTVHVAHYFELNHDIIHDPSIEFGVVKRGDYEEWTPLNINQVWGRWKQCAEKNNEDQVNLIDPVLQAEIASMAETWGRNIRLQRWLEDCKVSSSEWVNEPLPDDSGSD